MIDTVNFSSITSEIFILAALCCIMIVDLFQRDKERYLTFLLTQLVFIVLFIIGAQQLGEASVSSFSGHWKLDQFSLILKLAIYSITFISLFYARAFIRERNLMRGEYYLLTLFSVLGMMIMVSAGSLLIVYLGLELLSLSLYALVALQRDSNQASEAAVKYFVMGGLASGFLLYGISLVYGVTGSIMIDQVAEYVSQNNANLMIQFGLVFIVVGIGFKFGAAPFHMWLPDIYHGSPSSITAYISSVPKIAAFGMMYRLLENSFGDAAQYWTGMITILAVMSIVLGNIVAVIQTNLKRMLSYSAIAHIGYFLLGISVGTEEAFSVSMFYIIVYALMTLAGFGIIIFMSSGDKDYQQISDLRGMGRYHPWYALMFTLVMVSMAGIPPFIGFWPKLEIFRLLINDGQVLLAVVAIAFSVVGLVYYLKVVKEMFFEESETSPPVSNSRTLKIALSINCLLLIVFGLMPDSIYQYCQSAFASLS
ncbi:MAG: NADH-quinone oxidoreductase subunit NuoN [Enterobacterales bacterium]|nr:NADH-quinone oxidoreductase subunit NuoN [Enterobacterales bacterium]